MMRMVLGAAFMALATGAIADNASGFYIGIEGTTFDAEFAGGLEGDGTGIGGLGGYRYAVSDRGYIMGELLYSDLDGSTSSNLSDFKSYYSGTFGGGYYISEQFSLSAFVGVAQFKSTVTNFGDKTDNGQIIGIGAAFDVTPSSTIGARIMRAYVDDDFGSSQGSSHIDALTLRYSYQF